MAIPIPQGFIPSTTEPIDDRFSVADQAARLAQPANEVYAGLLTYQRDNNTLYQLNNATAPQLTASWAEVGTGSGGGGAITINPTGTLMPLSSVGINGTNYEFVAALINALNQTDNVQVWVGTQAEFDAVTDRDNTFFFITDTPAGVAPVSAVQEGVNINITGNATSPVVNVDPALQGITGINNTGAGQDLIIGQTANDITINGEATFNDNAHFDDGITIGHAPVSTATTTVTDVIGFQGRGDTGNSAVVSVVDSTTSSNMSLVVRPVADTTSIEVDPAITGTVSAALNVVGGTTAAGVNGGRISINGQQLRMQTANSRVLLNEGGIQFGLATINETANYLDDYEEGTWVPTFPAAGAPTPTAVTATYTKVGNTVHLRGEVTFPASTLSVIIGITGLPFLAAPTGNSYNGGVLVNHNTAGANGPFRFVNLTNRGGLNIVQFFNADGSAFRYSDVPSTGTSPMNSFDFVVTYFTDA